MQERNGSRAAVDAPASSNAQSVTFSHSQSVSSAHISGLGTAGVRMNSTADVACFCTSFSKSPRPKAWQVGHALPKKYSTSVASVASAELLDIVAMVAMSAHISETLGLDYPKWQILIPN